MQCPNFVHIITRRRKGTGEEYNVVHSVKFIGVEELGSVRCEGTLRAFVEIKRDPYSCGCQDSGEISIVIRCPVCKGMFPTNGSPLLPDVNISAANIDQWITDRLGVIP